MLPKKTEPVERTDGAWLAYVNGLPLMHLDYSNRVFATRAEACAAIARAEGRT